MKKIIFLFLTMVLTLTIVTSILPIYASQEPEEPSFEFDLITYLQTEDLRIYSTVGNEFSEKTAITANKVSDKEKLSFHKNALGKNANKIVVYEINATENGKEIPPKGTLGITFVLPEDFDSEKTLVLTMPAQGKYDIAPCRKGGKTSITTFSDCLGTYILVETVNPITLSDFHVAYNWGVESVTPAPTKVPQNDENGINSLTVWIIVGAVVILLSGALTVIFCYKKKKDRI